MTRIDQLSEIGFATIKWWEAYLWYGADRLGKNFYRDLRDRFAEENEGELHIYMGREDLVLIHNDKLTTVSAQIQ